MLSKSQFNVDFCLKPVKLSNSFYFPAYVTFVRTAHERGIISASECDYAKSVGEFFDGACAPGAIDAAHAINKDSVSLTTFTYSLIEAKCRS